MPKAWLTVELEDYERHVELGHVGQAAAIRESLAGAIAAIQPDSMLYLGCAGGNGLKAASGMRRVVGVDLNPGYLEKAAQRHPAAEFLCWDLNNGAPHIPPVDLIFCALVLEYVDALEALLRSLSSRVTTNGRLVALLLGVKDDAPAVLPSPYRAALAGVGAEYKPISMHSFKEKAASAGWILHEAREISLPSGKYFSELILTLAPAQHTALDILA